MTAISVKGEIKSALKNNIVSKAEVKKIIAATGASVSNAEAKHLGDLYDRIAGPRPPQGATAGGAWPEFGNGAGEKLNAFFVQSKLPFGGNAQSIKDAITAAMARTELVPLDAKPAAASRLVPLWLPNPVGMMDGPSRTAFYDVAKEQFFLNVRDPWRPNGLDAWYGPISTTPSPTVD
jgi:hypothetical protein